MEINIEFCKKLLMDFNAIDSSIKMSLSDVLQKSTDFKSEVNKESFFRYGTKNDKVVIRLSFNYLDEKQTKNLKYYIDLDYYNLKYRKNKIENLLKYDN